MYQYTFIVLLLVHLSWATYIPNIGNEINNNLQAPFDINEAYTQLMFSYSAYCPESKIVNWNCFFCTFNASDTKGFQPALVVKNAPTNTFGYVGNLGKTIVVAFRGTQPDSLQNWITDLDVIRTKPYPNVPNAVVHSGFLDAYDVFKVAVRNAVFNLINSTQATKVVFTGHSLGAAIATLCAVDIVPSVKIPSYVYNFGSPRVGNLPFAKYYATVVPTTYRITNMADIVPHLPDEPMGFHHVAQEVWWSTNTHYNVCDGSGEDPKCADSRLIWSIPDHLHYLDIELVRDACPVGCCK